MHTSPSEHVSFPAHYHGTTKEKQILQSTINSLKKLASYNNNAKKNKYTLIKSISTFDMVFVYFLMFVC